MTGDVLCEKMKSILKIFEFNPSVSAAVSGEMIACAPRQHSLHNILTLVEEIRACEFQREKKPCCMAASLPYSFEGPQRTYFCSAVWLPWKQASVGFIYKSHGEDVQGGDCVVKVFSQHGGVVHRSYP